MRTLSGDKMKRITPVGGAPVGAGRMLGLAPSITSCCWIGGQPVQVTLEGGRKDGGACSSTSSAGGAGAAGGQGRTFRLSWMWR